MNVGYVGGEKRETGKRDEVLMGNMMVRMVVFVLVVMVLKKLGWGGVVKMMKGGEEDVGREMKWGEKRGKEGEVYVEEEGEELKKGGREGGEWGVDEKW